jgi:nucleoside-diphosphate-sugar epimerase
MHSIIREDIARVLKTDLPWEKLRGKTVLVTGANGFLPSYMLYTLLELNNQFDFGINVVGLVRNKTKAEDKFGDLLNRNDFELLIQDVSSPLTCDSTFDYIVHAASQASPRYYGIDPVGTAAANTIGTYHLLELARKCKSECFMFFSSSEVYGTVAAHQIPTKESDYGYIDPTNVRACYAESKRFGENLCISFFHQYQVPVKIVRPFHTYGPEMELNDGRVYADFIADIVGNRNIIMKSDGLASRAFCYSADATAGFFTVLLKGECATPYNVGNLEGESSIVNLAEILVNLFPDRKLRVEKWNPPNDGSYLPSTVLRNAPDTSKINALGWSATTDIPTGFLRTIQSYLNA